MQTKRQIQQLLASAGIRPNRRLGQNFLIDLNLMRLLIKSAEIAATDTVLEVGCGTGSLTEGLAEKAGRVIAVEMDSRLFEIAKRRLAKYENVQIINADILESKSAISSDLVTLIEGTRKNCAGRLILAANLPYNVASPVMMNLVGGKTVADVMYVTVQKEVAERMTAGPGGKHYGTLSIFLAATGDIKTIRVLKPTVFWPAPKVDSAMVSFVRREDKVSQIRNMALFGEVVSLFMGHRRKMLKACIKFAKGSLGAISNWPVIFEKCSVEPTSRPEQLRPQDFLALANLCNEQLRSGK